MLFIAQYKSCLHCILNLLNKKLCEVLEVKKAYCLRQHLGTSNTLYITHYKSTFNASIMSCNAPYNKDFDVPPKTISDSPVCGAFGYQTWAEGS